jgi:uncharacterized protein
MGERTSYPPGSFSWADVSTSDQDAAKDFYARLFGWEYDDEPAGDGVVYSMARLNGRYVAAISPQPREEAASGIPPHWNSYVTVEDVETSARETESLGGTLFGAPFDVFTAGRMAAIADPQGAVLMLWQPGDRIGAELVNVPGALTWNDLTTPDPDGATGFYGGLLGWTFQEMDSGGGPRYFVIFNGDRSNGGIMAQPPEVQGARPFWTPYFGADDVQATIGKVESLGGTLVVGPIRPPAGEFAVLRDPQGAAFAVFAGRFDD